jgi:hypothetical protein
MKEEIPPALEDKERFRPESLDIWVVPGVNEAPTNC